MIESTRARRFVDLLAVAHGGRPVVHSWFLWRDELRLVFHVQLNYGKWCTDVPMPAALVVGDLVGQKGEWLEHAPVETREFYVHGYQVTAEDAFACLLAGERADECARHFGPLFAEVRRLGRAWWRAIDELA